jgi:hypothetical protein
MGVLQMSAMNTEMTKERTEGWGGLSNARDAHYFINNRSLCGRWLVWGTPEWERNQELGTAPTKGTCKSCWKKRQKQDAKP